MSNIGITHRGGFYIKDIGAMVNQPHVREQIRRIGRLKMRDVNSEVESQFRSSPSDDILESQRTVAALRARVAELEQHLGRCLYREQQRGNSSVARIEREADVANKAEAKYDALREAVREAPCPMGESDFDPQGLCLGPETEVGSQRCWASGGDCWKRRALADGGE